MDADPGQRDGVDHPSGEVVAVHGDDCAVQEGRVSEEKSAPESRAFALAGHQP